MTIRRVETGSRWDNRSTLRTARVTAAQQALDASLDGFVADKRIDAAGIAFTTSDNKVLLLKRSDEGDHAGEWCFPGGRFEEGEDAMGAARRETLEETGHAVEDNTLEDLGCLSSGEGVDFTTFRQRIDNPFLPALDFEHTEYAWAPLDAPPEPLHPGVTPTIEKMALDRAPIERSTLAQDASPFAFDRSSVRSMDQDGRLHVMITNISKANVCEYLGSEIPDFEELGLDPETRYKLYRDPEELAKAVPTFNNIPVMSEHVPFTADDPQKEFIVGSTGTDTMFDAPYLRNSLVVWDTDAIEAIESRKKQELSSAYRYRADMTPGEHDGQKYDGVMRDIRGNHVAIVATGRAGSDVIVGDSKMESMTMQTKPLSRKATLAKGALLAYLRPKLAADSSIDLNKLLEDVTHSNWGKRKPGIVASLNAAVQSGKMKLAQDASIDNLTKLLDGLDSEDGGAAVPMKDDNDDAIAAVDADPCAEILTMLQGKLSPEELVAVTAKLKALAPAAAVDSTLSGVTDLEDADHKFLKDGGANDEPADFPGKPKTDTDDKKDVPMTKGAMDAAIKAATKAAEEATIKRLNGIKDAEAVVMPYVGKLAVAYDSAEGVYKAALAVLEIDVEGVDASAYRAIIQAQPRPGRPGHLRLASDSAALETASADFDKRFPEAKRLG